MLSTDQTSTTCTGSSFHKDARRPQCLPCQPLWRHQCQENSKHCEANVRLRRPGRSWCTENGTDCASHLSKRHHTCAAPSHLPQEESTPKRWLVTAWRPLWQLASYQLARTREWGPLPLEKSSGVLSPSVLCQSLGRTSQRQQHQLLPAPVFPWAVKNSTSLFLAISGLPIQCICGAEFDMHHAMTWPTGRFPSQCHNEVRDV